MMEHLRRDEMQTITVDCTVKIALPTMGQAKGAAIRKNPASAACSETDHRSRVLSVRGRTGAVLLMEPAREENVRDLSCAFQRCLKAVFRERVLYVCVDKPSRAYQFPEGISEFTLYRLRPSARCHSLRDRFLSGPFSWVGHIAKDFVWVYSCCSGHSEGRALSCSSVCRHGNRSTHCRTTLFDRRFLGTL